MKDELVIGRTRSSFGTSGEIKVESLSGETSHFVSLRRVTVRSASGSSDYAVESVRVTHKAVLMKLAGVDTPEDASRLRNREILVNRSQAAPLENGEYYYADLEGLSVMFQGSAIGKVTCIRESGAQALIEIETLTGKQVLVPFVENFFGEVRLKKGEIELLDSAVLE